MLKRLVSAAAAAVLMLCTALPVCAETSYVEEEVGVPPSILVMGDSIATGFALEVYDKGKENCESYANILKKRYEAELPADCGFNLKNVAVDGQTSTELLSALNSGKFDADIAGFDCIVISIGGNDLLGALWDTLKDINVGIASGDIGITDIVKIAASFGDLKDKLDENLAVFDSNIKAIAGYIKGRAKGELIIQTLYDPFQDFKKVPGLASIAQEKIARLDETIKLHAGDAGGGYTVCDVAPDFDGRAEELTRINLIDIHPNAEGHKVIAEVLDKTIRAKKYHYLKAVEVQAPAAEEKESGGTNVWLIVGIAAAVAAAGAVVAVIIIKKGRTAVNGKDINE